MKNKNTVMKAALVIVAIALAVFLAQKMMQETLPPSEPGQIVESASPEVPEVELQNAGF